jgi:hypothetical protein
MGNKQHKFEASGSSLEEVRENLNKKVKMRYPHGEVFEYDGRLLSFDGVRTHTYPVRVERKVIDGGTIHQATVKL